MRRKVIKQGHNTLTITLPSGWSKDNNIKPGNELFLKEDGNKLYISTKKNGEHERVNVDVTGMDIPLIWKYFMSIYREGYDEIRVNFDPNVRYDSPYKFFSHEKIDHKYTTSIKKTPMEILREITNRFIGLEIIEQHRDNCIIKNMVEFSSKEFDVTLRRIFLLIKHMFDVINESIKTNNPDLVINIHDEDINIDKFHDYCSRILNKTGLQNSRKHSLYFSTLYLLELIGDELKSASHHLLSLEKNKKMNNLRPLAQPTVDIFSLYYNLFYNFSKEKVIEISELDKKSYFTLPDAYQKSKKTGKSNLDDDEREVFNHFRRIMRFVNALTELRIEMEF
jgi:phosphate uptake regulator